MESICLRYAKNQSNFEETLSHLIREGPETKMGMGNTSANCKDSNRHFLSLVVKKTWKDF